MVFIIDGCSFHYAHTWSKAGISICWRHLVTSKRLSNPIFFGKRPCFHHTCATWNEQPSNIKTMIDMNPIQNHGIYIRWYLRSRCARKEQSLLFDLYKAFDQIESIQKLNFSPRRPIFLHVWARFYKLPA